jgi:hypothetical protein
MAVSMTKKPYKGVTWDLVDGVVVAREDGVEVYGGYQGDPRRAYKVVSGMASALTHKDGWTSSAGRVISPDGGYVGGYYMVEVPGPMYPVVWGPAGVLDMPILKGSNGFVSAVNNAGTGTGYYFNSQVDKGCVKFDRFGRTVVLPSPAGASSWQTESISSTGNVIGGSFSFIDGNAYKTEAALWVNGVVKTVRELLAKAGAEYPNIANGTVKKIDYTNNVYTFSLVGLEILDGGRYGSYNQYDIKGMPLW